MNVHSQSAAPVMTMNGMMETSLALNARPDTNDTKVGFEFLFFCGFLFFFCFFFCYFCFLFYDVRDGGSIYYCMMDDEDDDRFFVGKLLQGVHEWRVMKRKRVWMIWRVNLTLQMPISKKNSMSFMVI
jgi:hypothetical protein